MSAPEDREDGVPRRIRFPRRSQPRPPLWPIVAAFVALVVLLVISRFLRG